jgi:CRISPR-associated RAMP protein (TIGR02581 family)
MTSSEMAHVGPGMQGFESRVELRGRLELVTGLRVGAGRGEEVISTDLPVVKTVDGRPYIPGTSFKGAWRAFTEMVLRTVQAQPEVEERNLACFPLTRRQDVEGRPQPCLTMEGVKKLKDENQGSLAELDRVLRERSCWTCRVFGAPWLASKVLVRDLPVVEGTFGRSEMRDGVAIDRDTGKVSGGRKYQFEAVSAETEFGVEILIENGSQAELGLAWLGLRAMMLGAIPLGGARSRGLGQCRFVPDWANCCYVQATDLVSYLFEGTNSTDGGAVWQERTDGWIAAFKEVIGIGEEVSDG